MISSSSSSTIAESLNSTVCFIAGSVNSVHLFDLLLGQ